MRITPGDITMSAVYELMSTRGDDTAMPPLATELTDDAGGLAQIEAWINQLPPPP
jgi:hypothetical protein